MPVDAAQVRKPIRKLRKVFKRMDSRPLPDDVHDLRTNTRRLEAAASALDLNSRRKYRSLLKEISRARKRAGKVRDMDVLTGYAAGIHVHGESHCSVQLLEHLGAERRKQGKKLATVVEQHRSSVRRRLKRLSEDIDEILCESREADCDRSATSSRVAAAALTLKSQLSRPVRLDTKNLHSYRLKVKELRNVLRMAENGSDNAFIKALGNLKDEIGEWHDRQELSQIATDVLDHGTRCKFLDALKKTTEERYKRALADAEIMRRDFLRVSAGKTNKNKGRLRQLSPPVVEAISQVAA